MKMKCKSINLTASVTHLYYKNDINHVVVTTDDLQDILEIVFSVTTFIEDKLSL